MDVDDATLATSDPGFVEVWKCEQPPHGATYRVLEDVWDLDGGRRPVRTIYKVELVG